MVFFEGEHMSNLLSQFKELVETPLQRKYKEYIQNAVTRSNEQLSQLAKQTTEQIGIEIKQAGVETAQEFYGDYSPVAYRRRHSLNKIVQPKVTGTAIIVEYYASESLGNDYLAKLVWEEGYHGGAKSGVLAGISYSGAPRWTTYPFITNPVRWGRMAQKSESPEQREDKREENIIDKNVSQLINNVWNVIANNLK